MSGDNSGSLASDIITYIGVPLAVLGVLPILYNTFATLASLSRIKRMLKRSRLTALTRSDVVNRVIEIDLPRYAVMPLDRFQNRAEYWSLSSHPSSIRGGSWTTFNWKMNAIGMSTQRVEYADQVRQPQVDVAFDDLICYLMDLGAVTDPQGWKLLRSTGLWTPVGCSLMLSPDGREKALTVAPQDDADGNLSLAVNWSGSWTSRDHDHLPPYWIRLPAPTALAKKPKPQQAEEPEEKDVRPETSSQAETQDEAGSAEQESDPVSGQDINCQILVSGIVSAFTQADSTNEALSIDHLRTQMGKANGMWFATTATAYGTSSQTTLWNYKIPDEVLLFARRGSIPCGIMVLLGIVDERDTPDWATPHNDQLADHEQFVRRSREQQMAAAAEARMPPDQRNMAVRARREREMEQRMQDMRDRQRQEQQRAEQRMMEALQSPKWSNKLVAEHSLKWLQAQGEWHESLDVKQVVGFILHRMVLDAEFSSAICRMLDAWKSWADLGGMRRAEFHMVRDDQVIFAQATQLVALIMDASAGLEGTLAMDLQECMRVWKKVRLG